MRLVLGHYFLVPIKNLESFTLISVMGSLHQRIWLMLTNQYCHVNLPHCLYLYPIGTTLIKIPCLNQDIFTKACIDCYNRVRRSLFILSIRALAESRAVWRRGLGRQGDMEGSPILTSGAVSVYLGRELALIGPRCRIYWNLERSKRYHIIRVLLCEASEIKKDKPKFLPRLRDSLFETQSSDTAWSDYTEIADPNGSKPLE